jgi:hypothetical protein
LESKATLAELILEEVIRFTTELPQSLLQSVTDNLIGLQQFLLTTNYYACQRESKAQLLIGDFKVGLKHHSINCVSVTESFNLSEIYIDCSAWKTNGLDED